MKEVKISLLGGFQVYLDGQPVTAFESDKARALLAYLAVEGERSHRREALAELLWPGLGEGAARRNLRHTLFRLRQALCDRTSCAMLLDVTNQHVGLSRSGEMWLDVTAFTGLLEECRYHLHSGEQACGQCLSRRRRAMELYRGDFLQGFSLPDSHAFTEWVVFKQEELHRLAVETLQALTAYYERAGDLERVRHYAHRQIELEPWREEAYRQEMLTMALVGQREAALRQFEVCRQVLADELDLEPSLATVNLYEAIKAGRIGPSAIAVGGLSAVASGVEVGLSTGGGRRSAGAVRPFVGREEEMARLRRGLERALEGDGQVLFVRGEAGSGKSALVAEFARIATREHPDLVVTWGRCTSLMGMGDAYEPFREALSLLAGEADAVAANGALTSEQVDRLLACLPATAQAIVEVGPRLVGRMLSGKGLLASVDPAPGGRQRQGWMARLEAMVNPAGAVGIGSAGLGALLVQQQAQVTQPELFTEITDVLRAIAGKQPLLLVLEDMQWGGKGAANLLFYLARHLAASRLLVVVSYRSGRGEGSAEEGAEPLQRVVQELCMERGEIEVDLDQADGRRFIDDLLDSEPNRLGREFRQTLYEHTRGQALFTFEVLRGLQARGELLKDQDGRWTCGPGVEWGRVPPRVAAAIAERVSLLPAGARLVLEAAAVEGNVFTLELLLGLVKRLGLDEASALRMLSHDLCRTHRLVEPVGISRVASRTGSGADRVMRYRFSHELYRKYLYGEIEPLERIRLHLEVGEGLERLYGFGPEAEEMAAHLAYHFEQAGAHVKAAGYLLVAGRRETRLCAWESAMAAFAHGIALLHRGEAARPPEGENAELASRMQIALADTMLAAAGWGGIEHMQGLAEARMASEGVGGSFTVVDEETHEPERVALGHFASGLSKLALGEFGPAREHLEQALALHRQHGSGGLDDALAVHEMSSAHSNTMAITCVLLAQVLWALGYPDEANWYLELAEVHVREGADVLAHGLILSMAGYQSYLLHHDPLQAQHRATALARLIEEHALHVLQPWADVLGGWAKVVQGKPGAGVADLQRGVSAWRDWGSRLGRPVQLMMLGEAYCRAGRPVEGLAQVEEAEQAMASMGGHFLEAELHRLRGEMVWAQGREHAAEAEACFSEAMKVAHAQKALSWELRAALSMARLLRAQGKQEQALTLLDGLYPRFTEGRATADLVEARALLEALRR